MKRSQTVKPDIKAQIKVEAGKRILIIAPEWKQRNVIARSVELRNIKDSRALTTEEQAELDGAQALWDSIKAIRVYSNKLEQDVKDNKTVDIASGWPT